MTIRRNPFLCALAGTLLLAGCGETESGPIVVAAIGEAPRLLNPNLMPLDAPSAILTQAVAQGLVQFDAGGQVEPALAQSWIVSDDGLRYTFRLARLRWTEGEEVTAKQVVERLRAAGSRASRNALKPLLGAIAEVEPMTHNVLEISLKSPQPNFLQLLAQPEMAILQDGRGTGPYRATERGDGSILLSIPPPEAEEEEADDRAAADIILRGEPAALAIARFAAGAADLVTGGTAGNLVIARAAELRAAELRFDPAPGMFGLAFASERAPLDNPEVRRALSMAVDRDALVAALAVPELQPRISLLPTGVEELPQPTIPGWAANPLPIRRQIAAGTIAGLGREKPLTLRVAMPDEPGYRLLFAHLRRDWRLIGIEAELVEPQDRKADLRLVDQIAPALLASWYLRRFACDASPACSEEADAALEVARNAPNNAMRQANLAAADRLLEAAAAFIPLAAPVRWSLVSPRLTGFSPNVFARHLPGNLVAARP